MRNLVVCLVLIAVLSVPAYSEVVIGNWEDGSSDGWIDWIEYGTGKSVTDPINSPKYSFSTIGATLGSESLQITQSGWNQNLAIKLQNNGLVDDFFANTIFQIDVTYPTTNAKGWQEMWEVALNAQSYGWHALSDNPIPGSHVNYGPGGGPETTFTLSFDYSSALSKIASNPSYVEFIISTNSDASHGVFYFDNARLVSEPEIVPEPATIVMLCLGGLALFHRGRK